MANSIQNLKTQQKVLDAFLTGSLSKTIADYGKRLHKQSQLRIDLENNLNKEIDEIKSKIKELEYEII